MNKDNEKTIIATSEHQTFYFSKPYKLSNREEFKVKNTKKGITICFSKSL